MPKYTDDEIRIMKKITCKIAGDYLGISSMAVSIGIIFFQLDLLFIMKIEIERILKAGLTILLLRD